MTTQHETLNEVRRLVAMYEKDVALVVNHSGGKDSTRMLGYIREHLPNVKTYVVMADTGFEHEGAAEWSGKLASRFGLSVRVVRNPNKTYLEMVERRGKFPGTGTRQCTSDLKRGPIQKFIRNEVRETIIINCMGSRAEESASRANQMPWKFDEAMSKAGRVVWNWLPIFDEKLTGVLRWHWNTRTPLHPVYVAEYHNDGTTGGYLRRFSCRVCIFATDHDIKQIYIHDRSAFDAVANLEQKIGFTMKHGKSLFQIIGQLAPPNDCAG